MGKELVEGIPFLVPHRGHELHRHNVLHEWRKETRLWKFSSRVHCQLQKITTQDYLNPTERSGIKSRVTRFGVQRFK